jgi:ribosomal protein L12E/L44/L45/RPP1/RPP2
LVEAHLRIALLIGLVALLAVPASAQRAHGKRDQSEGKQQTAEQRKKTREAAEEAYKAALGKVPDQKPADPWKNVR